jgi:hypothetical protein
MPSATFGWTEKALSRCQCLDLGLHRSQSHKLKEKEKFYSL